MTVSWEAKKRSTSALFLAGVLVVVGAAIGTVLLWSPPTRAALPLQAEALFEAGTPTLFETGPDGTWLPVAAGERSHWLPPGGRVGPLDGSTPASPAASASGEGPLIHPPRDSLAELQEFRSFAAEALEEVRSEKAETFRKGIEHRRGNLDERVAHRAESLGLSLEQAGKLRSSLLRQLDRDEEYVRLWEAGSEDAYLAELKAADRQRFHGELAIFLTAEQLRRAREWP